MIGSSTDYSVIEQAKSTLRDVFNVPEAVIKYRLENLKYEIYQYMNGTSIKNIEILSLKQQEKRKIKIDSLNTISDNDFMQKMANWYCEQL